MTCDAARYSPSRASFGSRHLYWHCLASTATSSYTNYYRNSASLDFLCSKPVKNYSNGLGLPKTCRHYSQSSAYATIACFWSCLTQRGFGNLAERTSPFVKAIGPALFCFGSRGTCGCCLLFARRCSKSSSL